MCTPPPYHHRLRQPQWTIASFCQHRFDHPSQPAWPALRQPGPSSLQPSTSNLPTPTSYYCLFPLLTISPPLSSFTTRAPCLILPFRLPSPRLNPHTRSFLSSTSCTINVNITIALRSHHQHISTPLSLTQLALSHPSSILDPRPRNRRRHTPSDHTTIS